MVNIKKYIKALLHPACGHQGSHKAHQAGDANIYTNRHATSPCEHGDLRFLHPFFVLSPYSQLSPYFTHFPEKISICTKPV